MKNTLSIIFDKCCHVSSWSDFPSVVFKSFFSSTFSFLSIVVSVKWASSTFEPLEHDPHFFIQATRMRHEFVKVFTHSGIFSSSGLKCKLRTKMVRHTDTTPRKRIKTRYTAENILKHYYHWIVIKYHCRFNTFNNNRYKW